MSEEKPTTRIQTIFDDISQRVLRFWQWLPVPSNLLSIIAIIAALVVLAIDKVLKSDEELRAKREYLLEITDKIINIQDELGEKRDGEKRDGKTGQPDLLDFFCAASFAHSLHLGNETSARA